MAEKVDIIDIDLSKLKKEAKDASNSIEDLNDNLKETEKVSDKLGKSLKDASGNIKDLEDSAEAASDKTEILLTGMEHTTNIAAGMVGSVQAVEGALQLMGIESEEVTQAIQKMQAIMAITDGLRAMAEAAKSFKELRQMVDETQVAAKGLSTANVVSTASTIANTAASAANTTSKIENTAVTTALIDKEISEAEAALAAAKAKTASRLATSGWNKVAAQAIVATGAVTNSELKEAEAALAAAQAKRASAAANATDIAGKTANATATTLLGKANLFAVNTFKKLKTAMLANPWTAIILALTAAYAGIKTWMSSCSEAARRQKKLAAANKAVAKSIEDNVTAYEREAKFMAARGESEKEILKYKLKEAEINYKMAEAHKNMVLADKDATTEMREEALATTQAAWEGYLSVLDAMTELDISSRREAAEQAEEDRKTRAAEAAAALKQEKDNELDMAMRYDEQMMQLRAQAYDNYLQLQVDYNRKADQNKMSERDAERDILKNEYDDNVKEWTEQHKIGILLDDEFNRLKLLNHQEYLNELAKLNKKFDEEDEKARQEKIQALNDNFEAMRALISAKYENIENKLHLSGDEVGANEAGQEKMGYIVASYEKQIEILKQLGIDTSFLTEELEDAKNTAELYIQQTIIAQIDSIRSLIDTAKGSFDELNAIGNGVSDQWGTVFDSMTAGLDRVQHAVEKGGKGWSKYGAMASAGLHVASSMLMAIADEQNESTEEGFEKQKKLQIAAASMAMMGGIIDAWTSAMNPANAWMTIWGQVAAGAATSAMILATGIMQINAIKRQKMDGSGGEGGAVANPALSALTNLGSGVSATTEIEGASIEGKVQDTRVYVVESDITSSQNNVKTSVDEATY